ncbi:MAG TPA: PKD domain-containing protein [Candidatus Pacearchaeota archaeon]|nr:PKD domain-containing protein [Candidatus Pacearchaeota archaeon]
MKTKNLTLISLMLGVMMLVSVSGLVSAETGEELPAPCAVTVSKPTADWYNGDVPIEWGYPESCTVATQLIQRKDGSDLDDIKYIGDNHQRTATWLTDDPFFEEGEFSLCVYVGQYGQVDQIGCSAEFGVDRTKPVITTSDKTCDEGETITLTASATDALSGVNSGSWAWDLGSAEVSGDSVSYTCLDGPATKTVSVSVSDNAENVQTEDVVITVNNVAPSVTGVSTSETLYEGGSVTLSATASDPSSDGDTPITFSWDIDNNEIFGDSNILSCSEDGEFEVGVKATDADGDEGSVYTATIVCYNKVPVVNSLSVSPASIYEEESTTLTATVSDVGADDTTLSYTINWGDGSAFTTGSTSDGTIAATHQYMDDNADDEYTITLTVTDTDSESGSDNVEIEVLNKNPWNVDAGVDQNAAEGDYICFEGTATDVEADIPLTYNWDFGNGGSATGGSHACTTYTEKGPYTVTMTVSDKDGGSATDTLTVTVYEYKIHLNAGWNLISIPLVPEDTSIDFVFATILNKVAYEADDIATILQYDAVNDRWYKARPSAEDNPTGFVWDSSETYLENVVPGYGYYIKMDDETYLYLNGKKSYDVEGQNTNPVFGVPPSVTLAMDSWNLIGVYGRGNPLVNLALKSLEDEEGNKYYDILIDKFGGQWYYNTWSSLHSTDGYWISIKKAFGGEQTVEYKSNYAPDCYSHYSQVPA